MKTNVKYFEKGQKDITISYKSKKEAKAAIQEFRTSATPKERTERQMEAHLV